MTDGADAVPEPYAAACRAAAELLAALPGPLSRLRVSHGDVLGEIEWRASEAPATVPSSGAPAGPAATVQAAPHLADAPGDAGSEARPAADPGVGYIRAATVGTFYRSPEPGAAPFVSEGDTLAPGKQVAILESMKMMVPVEADCTGEVVKFLVPNGGAVEYGEPLIEVALAS